MEDFYYAGGLRALMQRVRDHLRLDQLTVTGKTVAENIEGAECFNDDVIRPMGNPVYREGALAVLRGNLAPDGCVIKPSAMSEKFMRHAGPALVFDDYPSMKKMLEDENADVTEDHVIVLRNAGPKGGPGMPEWGMIPMPVKLLKEGKRDMLRISDARMSGTSYGACVLHVAPEAFIGGNLALIRTGDRISVDIPARTIHADVSGEEFARRRAAWKPLPPRFARGYGWMFTQHIQQANEGCDMDFLQSQFGESAGEPDIF
jgi:dihydroxy-acid dehydratase